MNLYNNPGIWYLWTYSRNSFYKKDNGENKL